MTGALHLPPRALGYLAGIHPDVPEGVRSALGLPAPAGPGGAGGGEAGGEVVAELTAGAVSLLDEVLRHPGGGRELAFRLLAADALLTWATEAAADAPRPDRALREVLAALTRSAP